MTGLLCMVAAVEANASEHNMQLICMYIDKGLVNCCNMCIVVRSASQCLRVCVGQLAGSVEGCVSAANSNLYDGVDIYSPVPSHPLSP